MRRWTARVLVPLGVLALLAAPVAAAELQHFLTPERAPFDPLFRKLTRLTHATVGVACGSTVAPWAYRGTRGQSTALRAAFTAEADEAWTKRFVRTLMRAADWDSSTHCSGSGHACDDSTSASPMFVVTLRGRPDTYALLLFDERCAIVFEADRALGSLKMGDRADSLFAQIQQALPAAGRALSMPAASADTSAVDTILFGRFPDDSLPEALVKVPPVYPERARLDAASGTVWVQALIGKDGTVKDAFAVHPKPYLDNAALDAVWQWKFKPASRHGEPLPVWVLVPVKFTLH